LTVVLTVTTVKNFEVFKIQDGGGRHLEISKNRDISTTVEAISTKFGIVMQFHRLDRTDR